MTPGSRLETSMGKRRAERDGPAADPPWRRTWQRAREAIRLLRAGSAPVLWRAIALRFRSRTVALGLRRDLSAPHCTPPPRVAVEVRPVRPGDDLSLLDVGPGTSRAEAAIRVSLRRLLQLGLPTCWVSAAPGGPVCHTQWLILSADDAAIHREWGDLFPALHRDEALAEGAYVAEAVRGRGLMANGVEQVALAARRFGARYLVTFVGVENTPSLKACRRAGLVPYLERVEAWHLFRRRVTFRPLPEGADYPPAVLRRPGAERAVAEPAGVRAGAR